MKRFIEILKFSRGFDEVSSQKNESIKTNLTKEIYEIFEAIDLQDSKGLKESFVSLIFEVIRCFDTGEQENISFDDVVDGLCKKMIYKYPDVFFKKDEEKCKVYNISHCNRRVSSFGKNKNFRENFLNSKINFDSNLSALVKTFKIQERASRFGYGPFSVDDALNEAFERLHYLETLILGMRQECFEKEIGNLLFSIAEIARLLGINAEKALCNSSEKFKNEFLYKISLENKDKL